MDIYRAHAHSISQCLWSPCPVLATEFMPRSQGTSGNNPGLDGEGEKLLLWVFGNVTNHWGMRHSERLCKFAQANSQGVEPLLSSPRPRTGYSAGLTAEPGGKASAGFWHDVMAASSPAHLPSGLRGSIGPRGLVCCTVAQLSAFLALYSTVDSLIFWSKIKTVFLRILGWQIVDFPDQFSLLSFLSPHLSPVCKLLLSSCFICIS